MNSKVAPYNPTEEKINTLSHLAGMLLSIIALILMLIKGFHIGSSIHSISYAVFGISMIILYTASTLYHREQNLEKKAQLNKFDHIAIYFLIAGTYTPFTLLVLKGAWGWSILGSVWGIALVGFILKIFFTGRFKLASTISYVLMGWVIIIAIKPLLANISNEGLLWLMIGGVFYTVGAIFYSIKKIPFNHAIFHFFVLGGYIEKLFNFFAKKNLKN